MIDFLLFIIILLGSNIDRDPYFTSDFENNPMYQPVTRVSETSTSDNMYI